MPTRVLPWLFVCIHVLFAAGVYPTLPPRVPTHLDFNGVVYQWNGNRYVGYLCTTDIADKFGLLHV